MKYINREYGFEGRPPYFSEFYKEANKGPNINASNFPSHSIAGAGLDPHAPNGAVLVGVKGTMWGIRISYLKNGKWYDKADFIKDKGRMFAAHPGGSFTYFSHGDVTATWVIGEGKLATSISTIANTRIRIIYYPVAPSEGIYKANAELIKGTAPSYAVIQGKISLSEESCVFKDRYDVLMNTEKNQREYFIAQAYGEASAIIPGEGNSVMYEYDLSGNDNSRLLLYAAVGDKLVLEEAIPKKEELSELISTSEIEYSSLRTSGLGVLGSVIENLLDSTIWYRVYNPYFLGCTFMPSRKIDEFYSFKGIEFNSANLAGSYLADVTAAENSLKYGVSDKVFSVLSAWVIYCRNCNGKMLSEIFDKYKDIYKPDSELILSNWKNKMEVAYKMPASPLKELNRSENMYSLDMSCIKLLNMDLLERMANVLNNSIANEYKLAKVMLKEKINSTLFNSNLGIYMNRYIDGDFAATIGITSFYPLIAGVVDNPNKLERMASYLTNPKKFGGDVMVSTLSKDHPEYGTKGKDLVTGLLQLPYEDYRGMIVPYMNYIVYLGLVRYGMDSIASDIAFKSAKLYKKYSERNDLNSLEIYLPNHKLHSKVTESHITGNLLAVIGVSELIDIEYFRNDKEIAIKFGTKVKGEHSASNIPLLGHRFSITITDTLTYVYIDNCEMFMGEGGRFVIRQYVSSGENCEFLIDADSHILITLSLAIMSESIAPTKVTFAVEKGRSRVRINTVHVNVDKIVAEVKI